VIPKTCVEKKIRIYNNYEELAVKDENEQQKTTEITDAFTEQNKTVQIRIFCMDDLSERQRTQIKNALKEYGKPTVAFNPFGIITSSYPFLDHVAGILKEDPEIRLEIVLQAAEDGIPGNTMVTSEKWAQELTFYFKDKEIDMDALHCKGSGLSHPIFEPFVQDKITTDGVIDFIFMVK
jgi:outer membrane protein OmpA-like peptidoglycan-associated protein